MIRNEAARNSVKRNNAIRKWGYKGRSHKNHIGKRDTLTEDFFEDIELYMRLIPKKSNILTL
jgi:hypothetical protein